MPGQASLSSFSKRSFLETLPFTPFPTTPFSFPAVPASAGWTLATTTFWIRDLLELVPLTRRTHFLGCRI